MGPRRFNSSRDLSFLAAVSAVGPPIGYNLALRLNIENAKAN